MLLPAACASGRGTSPAPGESGRTAKYERFLVHPTVVRADTIRAIFPMQYRDEVAVRGLSTGWRDEGNRRVWRGTGKVEVRLRKLVLSGGSVTVTLVAQRPEPEVVIQADGNVAFGHSSHGMVTEWEGRSFLLIRNDGWLEK